MSGHRLSRLEACARAAAVVRYPLLDKPVPQEIDYEEAKRFIAMWDSMTRRRFDQPTTPAIGFKDDATSGDKTLLYLKQGA